MIYLHPSGQKDIKKNTGFESDTLQMIRFACFVISIQQFPGFATKSILLAKSTYKIIMIKNYHILDTKNYTYVLNFIKMSFGFDCTQMIKFVYSFDQMRR